MSKDENEIRASLLEKTLNYLAADYSILERTFAGLDAKAQATFAVAGIFLALLGNLIADPQIAAAITGSCAAIPLFFITLGGLLGSTLLCIWAMRIRRIPTPLEGEKLSEVAGDVLAPQGDVSTETYEGWFREQIGAWEQPLREMRQVNEEKAAWVLRAQGVLMAAIISSSALAVMYVFNA